MDRATAGQASLTGVHPCASRPPGGSYNSTTLRPAQQRRMRVAGPWLVDTGDWKAKGSSSSDPVNGIISLAEKGGSLRHPVALRHTSRPGNPATVRALPDHHQVLPQPRIHPS